MSGPGYGAQCRPCNSPSRAEIDRRLLAGDTVRGVSAWLAEQGERIPFQALANHKAQHLDVRAEAIAMVDAARPAFDAAVAKIIADVSVLDEVASIALDVARKLAPVVSDPDRKPSQPIATIFGAALSNARAAVTDRHELLHGKKLEVTDTAALNASDPRWAALQREVFGAPRQGIPHGPDGDPSSVASGELPEVSAPMDPR